MCRYSKNERLQDQKKTVHGKKRSVRGREGVYGRKGVLEEKEQHACRRVGKEGLDRMRESYKNSIGREGKGTRE